VSSGDGFGVAVTVSPRFSACPDGFPAPPPGVRRRRTRLSEVVDVAGMSAAGLVGELAALADARSQLVAYDAVVVARFAALRPAGTDLTSDQPGGGLDAGRPAARGVGVLRR